MKTKIKLFVLFLFVVNTVTAQDIIAKKDGTIIQVYNLEESNNFYFYSLEPSEKATTYKIKKGDVFSVKKNGKSTSSQTVSEKAKEVKRRSTHDVVIAQISSKIINDKGNRRFSARTPDGHELIYQIISEADGTLAVAKGEYHETEYIVPEYVQVQDFTYTVTELGEKAFYMETTIKNIQLPSTLKKIGKKAMSSCESLTKIILPEGLEEIGDKAFSWTGVSKESLSEIYIPSTVKIIGSDSFLFCSGDTSYRGFCQGYFSNMPDFITEGNCKRFGIDEVAVKSYYDRKK